MEIEEEINNLLNSKNYDIRESHNARFTDQKVTPDVLCIIADCILNLIEAFPIKKNKFTSREIWNLEYTSSNVKMIFSKPGINNQNASNEYDKFFQQPLKMLAYSGVLTESKIGSRCYYKLENEKILNFISIRERNSLKFIQEYLIKVLKDSEIYNEFKNFLERQDRMSFINLKTNYENFIIESTPINGKTEVRRIFTKILNPIAYKFNKKGTIRGTLSLDIITYDQLMYNRKNWRDIQKLNSETRAEYEIRAKNEIRLLEENSFKYTEQKAKNIIRKHYNFISEITDDLSNGLANEVHHIFPSSDFPLIKSYTENLILLTSSQHRTKAHPRSNFSFVDRDYQYLCLITKSKNIEISLNQSEFIYSLKDYIFVLNTGFDSNFFTEEMNFDQIRNKIEELY